MSKGEAIRIARSALSTSATWLGIAAVIMAVAAAPADAKKKRQAEPIDESLAAADSAEPMTLIVSLANQRVEVYRGTTLITSAGVSSGKRGYRTKAGVFSILEKKRHHYSNLYAGAPMPWMQRLTWSGTAFHAGALPGYPASHGCIRLPYSFAPRLFKMTSVGEHVVVAQSRVEPKMIEHGALFQPLPSPAPPILVKQEPVQRQSSNETAPAHISGRPVILARAEVGDTTTDVPSTIEVRAAETAEDSKPAESPSAISAHGPAILEDTRTHAIDPFAETTSIAAGIHAVPGQPRLAGGGHALDKLAVSGAAPAKAAAAEVAPAALTESAKGPALAADLEIAAKGAATLIAPAEAAPVEPALIPVITVALAAAVADPAPPIPTPAPSVLLAKLQQGMRAAAIEAAEPRSTAPLRVLVTRRTKRDRIIDVQYALSAMGHLDAQSFDGTLGRQTVSAIKAFQKEQGLPETGSFDEELVKKIYEVAGKAEPPVGHLFVRQEFGHVFDSPVTFRDPEEPLGTHVFTALSFAPGDTKARWMGISLQGDDPAAVLDRLVIPDEIRRKIAERLTPGSSLIVGDLAINSATLPKGADFLVWAKDTPAKIQPASLTSETVSPRPRKKRVRSTRRNTRIYQPPQHRRNFRGWPW